MIHSFCIHNSPQMVTVALCNNENIVAHYAIPNNQTSAQLIPLMDKLLRINSLSIQDCHYIVATQGPAPFSALRASLATINGIQAGTSIPLIGIDSLVLLASSPLHTTHTFSIALLDAYNKELYYAVHNHSTGTVTTGYGDRATTLDALGALIGTNQAVLLGYAAALYAELLKQRFGSTIIMSDARMSFPSVQDVVQAGWNQWQKGAISPRPLMPLYLKKHHAER